MNTKLKSFLQEGGALLALIVLFLALLLAVQVLGHAAEPGVPNVKMAWTMAPEYYALRGQKLTAYPVGASDLEMRVWCTYLGNLDVYIWQFNAPIPEKYRAGDWILYGQGAGYVVAQKFKLQNGATLAFVPAFFEAPLRIFTAEGTQVQYRPPEFPADVVVRWEVLKDGVPIPTGPDGKPAKESELEGTSATQIRGVLAGGPKAHYILGPMLTLIPVASGGGRT